MSVDKVTGDSLLASDLSNHLKGSDKWSTQHGINEHTKGKRKEDIAEEEEKRNRIETNIHLP
jgi:hypothetical protein